MALHVLADDLKKRVSKARSLAIVTPPIHAGIIAHVCTENKRKLREIADAGFGSQAISGGSRTPKYKTVGTTYSLA